MEHLHQSAHAIFGAGPKAERWLQRQKDRLWNGHIGRIVSEMAQRCRQLGPPPNKASENDPRRIVANNLQYFRQNRGGMDYPTFRKSGWPVGSGIIESTIKQLGKRVKGTEKHWSVDGVEGTLQVIAQLVSEDDSREDFRHRCPLAPAA